MAPGAGSRYLDFVTMYVYPETGDRSAVLIFSGTRFFRYSMNFRRAALPLLLAGFLGALFGLAGCERHRPAAGQNAAAAKARVDTNPEEPGKSLPADFQKTMPIFPGAEIASVRKPKGAMREIFFASDGQLDPMIAFYKDTLLKNGYEITATLKMAARKTWSCDFHKGGQQASVMLFPSDKDKSRMTIDLIYEIPTKAVMAADPLQENFDVVGPGEVAQQTQTTNPTEKRN